MINDCLGNVTMFKGLTNSQLNTLVEVGEERKLKQGEIIFAEDSPGNSFVVIGDGKVEIAKYVAGGRRRVLAILNRGDVFGEISMFQDVKRSAAARAETDCLLVLFAKEAFLGFLDEHRDIASVVYLHVIRDLSERLRVTNEKLNESAVWGFQEALAL